MSSNGVELIQGCAASVRKRQVLYQGLYREKAASELIAALGIQVLLDHDGDLEEDCVFKLAQVQTRDLFHLFQTVNKRVAVDVQLARRFGYVEVVFKEAVDRVERVIVEGLNGVFLEASPAADR